MIRTFLYCMVFLLVGLFSAQAQDGSDDILIQLRVNSQNQSEWLEKMNQFLSNKDQPSVFHRQLNPNKTISITIPFEKIINPILQKPGNEATRHEILELIRGYHLEPSLCKWEIELKGIHYDLEEPSIAFLPDLPSESDPTFTPGEIKVPFRAKQLTLTADSVLVKLYLAHEGDQFPVEFFRAETNPFTVTLDSSGFKGDWFSSVLSPAFDHHKMHWILERWDTTPLQNALVDEKINFIHSPWNWVSSPITFFKKRQKEIIDSAKINAFLMKKEEVIDQKIIDAFLKLLQSEKLNEQTAHFADLPFDPSFWIKVDMMSTFKVSALQPVRDSQSLLASLKGEFYTFDEFKEAKKQDPMPPQLPLPAVRVISAEDAQASLEGINTEIKNGADVVVSLHENYVDRLLQKLIQSGALSPYIPKRLSIGSKGAFVLFDQVSDELRVVIDARLSLTRAESILFGKHFLEFPVLGRIGLRFVQNPEDAFTTLEFFLKDINVEPQFLREGLPQYGLPSDLKKIPFKKKLSEYLQKKLATRVNRVFLKARIKVLNCMKLDTTHIYSDGKGRVNGVLHFTE